MHFYLERPKSADPTLIYLIHFVKEEGKNFKYSTGQKILPEAWNFETRGPRIRRGKVAAEINHLSVVLARYEEQLHKTITRCEAHRTAVTREVLRGDFDVAFGRRLGSKPFHQLAEVVTLFIKNKKEAGQVSPSTLKGYGFFRKNLILFEQHVGRKTKVTAVNQQWLDNFSSFLRNKLHFNDNSSLSVLTSFKSIAHWANEHYPGSFKELKKPVKGYVPDTAHLTHQEIQCWEDGAPISKTMEVAKDLFLLGVYSGQRFSDYSTFERAERQGNVIVKKAEKTEHDSFIPLHRRLTELLDKYNWLLPKVSMSTFSRNLKKYGKIVGLDEPVKKTIYRGSQKEVIVCPKWQLISSHTARRTFITLSAEQGMPDHALAKIAGIRSAQTLARYKKTSQHSVYEAMRKVWGE